jgi:hypothetical protein
MKMERSITSPMPAVPVFNVVGVKRVKVEIQFSVRGLGFH